MRETLEWACAYLLVIGGAVCIGSIGYFALTMITPRGRAAARDRRVRQRNLPTRLGKSGVGAPPQ
ncbi:hypothetical protein OVY01_04915 [Robbsia sp. Bb-Pol-6]|uniref:Uncharacterized protein n=1 Tax=Robbsia betulipollinis TaxID=2981849 RepID=A0ABT3ZJ86_9BURK|nr:hypothetical protein [Robbsia betulipollinis]MCY0386588.1 hypothetical protein [Robbsia betulipollinis]